MANLWFKTDVGILTNPKVIRIRRAVPGSDVGLAVVIEILARNRTHSRDGALTRSDVDPISLGQAVGYAETDVQKVVEAMIRHGFLEPDPDTGGARLVGWDDAWRGPLTVCERSRRWRQAKGRQEGT